MFITVVVSVITALLYFFAPLPSSVEIKYLINIILLGGTAVFFGTLFLNTLVLIPLTKIEEKLVPGTLSLLRRDKGLKIGRTFLFLFILLSFFCVALVARLHSPDYQDAFFIIWMILFGVALDVFRDSWKRLAHLASPAFATKRLYEEAEASIRNEDRSRLLTDLDNLSEVALHGVERGKIALSTQALQSFPPLLATAFSAIRSIGHTGESATLKKNDGDEASFILFYLLQRLELIYDRALRERMETACRQIVMALGKIIVEAGKLDFSMVSFPVHFLAKFGLKAQQHHFDEVATLTTSTLVETARALAQEDLTYSELKEPFQSILNGLAAIARGTFTKNKSTSIPVLLEPLQSLKTLFSKRALSTHRDAPFLRQKTQDIIDEFSILQQVVASQPVIAGETIS